MDRVLSASEANRRFSQMLRDVVDGDSFTVTLRGKAVARVVPVDYRGGRRAVEDLLKFLEGLPKRDSSPWTRESLYD